MGRPERYLFLIITFLVWVYIGIRSCSIPLIHDETVTYFLYFQTGNFIPPWAYWDANNHLLNSAIGALFHYLFGSAPIIVRLGSWLSFLPFAFFVYKIGTQYKSRIQQWAFIIPLLTAPFFIEFFGLARGYGMAMTWFLGSLYFAMKYIRTPSNKNLIWVSITGVLASLSSLSVIVAVLIIYGWILLFWVSQAPKNALKSGVKWFFIFLLPQLPLIYYVFLLKEKNLLYYGGDDVISYSLKPFAKYFLLHKELWWVVASAITILVLGHLIKMIQTYKKSFFQASSLIPFVLILSVISVFAQQFILGVNYPEDRAALYFFPLIIGAWVSFPFLSWKPVKIVWLAILLWFPIDLFTSANIQYSRLWIYEHTPTRFWEKVHRIQPNNYPASFSAYGLRNGIWNFQSLNKGYTSCPNSNEYPSKWADVIMVDSSRINQVDLTKYDAIDYDSISGQSLLVRNPRLIETPEFDTLLQNENISNTYLPMVEFNGSQWGEKPMALYFEFELQSSSDINHLYIITSLNDTNGTELYHCSYDLSLVSENWTKEGVWRVKQFLPKFPEKTGRFVSFIYNPKGESHYLKSMEIKLSTIEERKQIQN